MSNEPSNEPRGPNEPVGVLIVGAGASGGAFAWSIADIGTSVLCLEQGPWMKQRDFPTNFLDYETRAMGPFAPSPNVRGLPADYPVNERHSDITPLMFNAVGGSTILYAAHFPRFHPSDFRVKTLDGVADDWPVDYETLEPFFADNDRMMGVSGLAGDPAYPYHEPPLPPLPFGRVGNVMAAGFESTRLALVAVGQRDHLAGVRRPRPLHQPRLLHQRLRSGRQGEHRHHLLARRAAPRRDAQDQLPRARDHRTARWHGRRRPLLRRGGRAPGTEGGGRRPRLQRHRHAAAAAQLEDSTASPTGWRIAAAWWART